MVALEVSGWRHLLRERAQADLLISPEIRTSAQLGLDSRNWLVKAGEHAAQARVDEILRFFAKPAQETAAPTAAMAGIADGH